MHGDVINWLKRGIEEVLVDEARSAYRFVFNWGEWMAVSKVYLLGDATTNGGVKLFRRNTYFSTRENWRTTDIIIPLSEARDVAVSAAYQQLHDAVRRVALFAPFFEGPR